MMMNRIYRCLFIAALTLLTATCTKAQSCEPNMLFVQDSLGYAFVPKFSAAKLGTSFTIEFWMQSLRSQSGKGLLEIGKTAESGTIRFEIDSSSAINATVSFSGTDVSLKSQSIEQTQWIHIALTLSTTDTLKLYLNGTLAASQRVSSRVLRTRGDTLFIGRSSSLMTSLYGNIDELRFWSKERSASEIQSHKTTPLADTTSGLIAYYRMDDRTELLRLHDFSQKGNIGTLAAGAITTTSTSPVGRPDHQGYMLKAEVTTVDMGVMSCGGSKPSTVHIMNTGVDTLGIKSIGYARGNVFSITRTPPFPIYPGRKEPISIQADAKSIGTFIDTLIITSSTECGGVIKIVFKIRVDSAGVEFVNKEVLLGKIPACDLPKNSSVQLKNTGSAKATINSLQILDDVAIEVISPQIPFILDSGEVRDIKFRVLTLPPSKFISRLRIQTEECSKTAEVVFAGERTDVQYRLPVSISYPSEHISASGIIHDTTFLIINTGSSELFITDMKFVGDPVFRIERPLSGKIYLDPGDTATVRIRLDAESCGEFSSTLILKGVPCGIDTSILFSASIKGPMITTNDVYDLGSSCVARDTTITFINNSDITTILGKPVFDKTNIFTYVDGGLLPAQLLPGDSLTISVRFNPITPGAHSVNASLPLTPCGQVDITLTGLLGVGNISVSDSMIDFGLACDLIPQQKSVRITNNAGKNITVTSADIFGSPDYSLQSPIPPFTLLDGAARDIVVDYHPTSLGLDSAFIRMEDNGCYVTSIPIGGIREITSLRLVEDTIVFDVTCPTKRAVKNFGVENLGLGTVSISSAEYTGTAFGIGNLRDVKLGAKRVTTLPISFSPKSLGALSDKLTIVFGPCNDTLVLHVLGIGGPSPTITVKDTRVDFGEVKIGSSRIQCVQVTNPSCLPMIIEKSSVVFNGSFNFEFTDSTLALFPYTVTNDNPVTLCIRYSPMIESEDTTQFTILFAAESRSIVLTGRGIAPRISHSRKVLDFGDVLLGNSKTLDDTISNTGKLPVALTSTLPTGTVFTVLSVATGLAPGDDSLLRVTFAPQSATIYEDSVFLRWEQTTDTIILRGRGTGHGALINTTQLDFGDVRVNTSRQMQIAITAGDGFPVTLSNVSITPGSFTVSQPSVSILNTVSDTAYIIATYSPLVEQVDISVLSFDDNAGNNKTIPLKGRGVQAHLHLDTQYVDFGRVRIGSEHTSAIGVRNLGDYPLTITDARPTHRIVFDLHKLPKGVIPPRTLEVFEYLFKPISDRVYHDTVVVTSDSPEGERSIIFRGEGTYGDISYVVGSATVNVGDVVTIPVSLAGADLPSSTIDSFTCTIHYNPTVLFIHGILSVGTLSDGMTITVTRQPTDSLIHVHGFGKRLQLKDGVLFNLKTEALLGPVDTTTITLVTASPKHQSIQAAQGLFRVADCENYRTTIHYKGDYSLTAPKIHPVQTTLTFTYELGLDGFVSIDIVNEVGAVVKRVLAEHQKRGNHTIHFNVDDLPNGIYTYVLQSLEYRKSSSFIIAK